MTFYEDVDGFLAATVAYLRQGLEAGEPILAAFGHRKNELLRAELGADAGRVEFADIEAFGLNPARLIPAWHDFLAQHLPDGSPIRGLGEPVWPGRSAAAVDECERHESLLNLAFANAPSGSILCLYDSGALDDDVLEAALLNHPLRSLDGVAGANPDWDDHTPEPFAGALPPPPLGAFELGFDRDTLHTLRAAAGLEAAEAGLSEDRASDFVLAGSELAANSVQHGGGRGTATIWREPESLVLEVRDGGRLEQPLAGRVRPQPTQEHGRGLWVANQLCDLMQIRSGAAGTRVRLLMNLG
ncbi:MAG: anti-sigma factor RsbA family regulatory protein [Solirubrobacterales bacterium]